MKSTSFVVASGALFGLGLGVSGMTLPSKVKGFLDFTGHWDPSLMFVMMGAIGVHFVLIRLIRKRSAPWFNATFQIPTRSDFDKRLVLGAALFGVGWGLGGYCPGPGLVSVASGSLPAIVFVAAMTIGMAVQHLTDRPSRSPAESDPAPNAVTTET